MPGLIDSHAHPVFGDYTPRQRTSDFIESSLHGGVTTMISAGEPHVPGRPKDIVGLKALAIAVNHSYANVRPGGVKVRAGAPILELGMVEADFVELAAAGVRLIGEIGLGSVKSGADAAPMVAWGRANGMVSTYHTGGPSLPGLRARSGPTPSSRRTRISPATSTAGRRPCPSATSPGSSRATRASRWSWSTAATGARPSCALGAAAEARALDRVILGNDAPSGTGVVPLGILRLIAHLASLGGIAPETVVVPGDRQHRPGARPRCRGARAGQGRRPVHRGCARSVRSRTPRSAPWPTATCFGISMILVDGDAAHRSQPQYRPAARAAEVVKGPAIGGGGH